MGTPTDADIVAASLDSPARFGEIFDRHATSIHRYLVRRIGPDAADGMTSDVFRIAFERRASFDRTRPEARPWLYGIATNLVARSHRSEARRLRATARLAARRDQQVDIAERVSSEIDGSDEWNRVARALGDLPVGERDALLLHAWEGLSYEQVADALGVPIGTVRSRLNRARSRLREPADRSGEELHETARGRDPGRIGS